MLRLNTASRFLGHGKDIGDFHATRKISGQEKQKVIFTIDQFQGKKDKPLSWSAISNLTINLTDLDTKSQIPLFDAANNEHLLRIEMIDNPLNASGLPDLKNLNSLLLPMQNKRLPEEAFCNHWSFRTLFPKPATR